MTYAEKVLYAHMPDISSMIVRGKTSIAFDIDRVAMQDATAQMAILQFMSTGKDQVAVPATIHCDHLIIAAQGAEKDVQNALLEHNEVYQFLKSAASKYNLGFWKPGSGIIHQLILENYAVPGQLMIGTDSHTPNAGGLGMMAIGVGGMDAAEGMAGEQWSSTLPRLIGIHLKGTLKGWTSPKDVILKIVQILTVKGGTGAILEYFGEGARALGATGKATIANMGAETGATTSIFPYDEQSALYLKATQRAFVADAASAVEQELRADPEVEETPLQFYDEYIEIDLTRLEPHIAGPHTPDLSRPLSTVPEDALKNGWPLELTAVLIGSCTNSSYEDLQRAAAIAQQAAERGIRAKVPFMVTPGSEQIYKTIKRDGLLEIFARVGGKVLANACGPCIGQWKRQEVEQGTPNSIITSYNRNFRKRNDANPETYAFIGSPEVATAFAFTGRLDINPTIAELAAADGATFRLYPPSSGRLPDKGFEFDHSGYEAPKGGNVYINPQSERLAILQPFTAWNPDADFKDLFILLKTQGKCTTDQLSPAGTWLRYRGHLDKISDNMFSGAMNAFTGDFGKGRNLLTGETAAFSAIARFYKAHNKGWVVIGDTNYGEGSSREHAAMSPRYLGCRAVIAKSFARIHEVNLKKQGMLPLTFADPEDYARIREDDVVTIGNARLTEGKSVGIVLHHQDGSSTVISVNHTLTKEQIKWFIAGSAINLIKTRL